MNPVKNGKFEIPTHFMTRSYTKDSFLVLYFDYFRVHISFKIFWGLKLKFYGALMHKASGLTLKPWFWRSLPEESRRIFFT